MEENKIELSGIFSNGYGIIPKKMMQDKRLNIYDKCIIAYMLSFTGGGNSCFPSYKKIAEDLCISEPTIAKSIKNICNLGYIKKEKLYPENKLKHHNKYIMVFLNEVTLLNDVKSRTQADEVTSLTKLSSNNNSINNNISNNINESFETFWNLYDKKADRVKCEKLWNKIDIKLFRNIYEHVKIYVKSTPDKQYRKNPDTYLRNKCWNDEIINKEQPQPKQHRPSDNYNNDQIKWMKEDERSSKQ